MAKNGATTKTVNEFNKMTAQHVLIKCDVFCKWDDRPPVYRLFVGNELFTERTYIWKQQYLEELIPIYAGPGEYEIKYELVPPSQGTLKIKNMRIADGPPTATITKNLLRIYPNEST